MTNWSRRFQDHPIMMPGGRTIRTIGEAAEYATGLPRKIGIPSHGPRVLYEAAEHGGPFVFMARINFCKAVHVHGKTPPRIGNPEGKGISLGQEEAGEGPVKRQNAR
jgi:hypothetical protein